MSDPIIQKKMCPKCEKNKARRQMCGKCGHMNILPCSDCRRRTEACSECGTYLV